MRPKRVMARAPYVLWVAAQNESLEVDAAGDQARLV